MLVWRASPFTKGLAHQTTINACIDEKFLIGARITVLYLQDLHILPRL